MLPETSKQELTEPSWMKIARGELGVREIAGSKDNSRIVEYHQATTLKATDDETPWCSAFVNWCFAQVGIAGTRSAAARSWLGWGYPIKDPVPGCIAVLKRGSSPWQGHVGFYIEEGLTGHIRILGGNQGNAVKVEAFSVSNILSYRMPLERKAA